MDYKDFDYIDESDEDEFDNQAEIVSLILSNSDFFLITDFYFAISKLEKKIHDIKTLQFWIKNLLPRVGIYLKKLDLSNCKSLNNNLSRRILQLCPNIEYLNLSFTTISHNSFRGVRLDKLKALNCEGCVKLSDNAFKFLLLTSILDKNLNLKDKSQYCLKNDTMKCKILPKDLVQVEKLDDDIEKDCSEKKEMVRRFRRPIDCTSCTVTHNIEDLLKKEGQESDNSLSIQNPSLTQNSLESINLSGCWTLTDYGLSYLASKYDLSNLKYLNLSGCINLTAFGMNLFLEYSPELEGENLYYCDNIVDGPMKETANGCENLECGTKFCCRNIRDF
jgi:F-box/leucine-rich repeat protein 5